MSHDTELARLRMAQIRAAEDMVVASLPLELLRTASAPVNACKGDPGECLHNGACMYACGATPVSAAAQAISELLSLIRREAPQLSGKVMGNAQRVLDALSQTTLPAVREYSPMYPDECREAQYAAARYVSGWNDCHAAFMRALQAGKS